MYIDCKGIIGDSDDERSMADAPELSLTAILHERSGENRGEHRKASSRLSLVAHYGTHS